MTHRDEKRAWKNGNNKYFYTKNLILRVKNNIISMNLN